MNEETELVKENVKKMNSQELQNFLNEMIGYLKDYKKNKETIDMLAKNGLIGGLDKHCKFLEHIIPQYEEQITIITIEMLKRKEKPKFDESKLNNDFKEIPENHKISVERFISLIEFKLGNISKNLHCDSKVYPKQLVELVNISKDLIELYNLL